MKNKLFTKLGIAALGIAMAVVTGTAIQNAATETKAAETTSAVDLSAGAHGNSVITWTLDDSAVTIVQSKGNGTTAVNSSYIAAPRIYKGHILSFTASNDYKINKIELKYTSTYYGNSMTAGTTISNNVVSDNTSEVSRSWSTTSGGTHTISSVSSDGLSEIHIQNVASAANTQLRLTGINIAYTSSSGGNQGGSEPDSPTTPEPEQPSTPSNTYESNEMSSFSSISGFVSGTSDIIKYEAQKGSASTAPAVNSNQIRIYQNGGLLRIFSNDENYLLSNVTIGSDMTTKVVYKIGSNGEFTTTNTSINKGSKITVSDIDATEITFKCTGTDKNSRLYLNYLYVEYTSLQSNEGALESISTIQNNGYKKSYLDVENWEDPKLNLVVMGNYTDGEKEIPSIDIEWSFNPEKPTLGVTSVTITATCKNKNNEDISKSITISEIEVTVAPTYTKITKTAEIKDGGKFIIASGTNALGSAEDKFRNITDVQYASDSFDIIINAKQATILTITKDTNNSNYYNIKDGDNYLGLNSADNQLHTLNPYNADACQWNIKTNDDGLVFEHVKYAGRYIQYNQSSPRFACYTGTQTYPSLYEFTDDIPKLVPLTNITANDATVSEGSTIIYTGTYEPTNATENIVATISAEVATLGVVSMNNGTFELEIKGGSIETNTTATLTFSNETGTISRTATLLINEYTATHDLVTTKSSLQNGSKVVLGNVSESSRFIAKASTGGNNLPAVETAFDSEGQTIAYNTESQEFTVWCIDQENGYYVFSDGGYFLTAEGAKVEESGNKNYLKRTDELSEECYFELIETDDGTGVTVKSVFAPDFSLAYNVTSEIVSLYTSTSKTIQKVSLYLSKEAVDTVQGFIDVFMHMKNIDIEDLGTGNCIKNKYFESAMNAYNNDLTEDQRGEFLFIDDAFNRLNAWAIANNYEFANDFSLVAKQTKVIDLFNNTNNNNLTVIIVTASITVLSAFCLYAFARKTKRA